MTDTKVVLITGASTGIGRSIADVLTRHNFTVFGTSRNPHTVERPSGWNLVQLDVCSDESVEYCIQEVLKYTGRMDILINNAGYGLDGALEEATIEQVQSQFDTNYFGALRMIKTVLPTMRAQSGGYIINISSGNASIRFPFMGHYTATKCALEGFSEVLRQEVKPFGIHVSVVEPAFVKTNISETIRLGTDRIDQYEPFRTRWLEAIKKEVRNGPDPEVIARCVLRIVKSSRPRLMYISGPMLGLGIWIHRWLPEQLYQWLFSVQMGVSRR